MILTNVINVIITNSKKNKIISMHSRTKYVVNYMNYIVIIQRAIIQVVDNDNDNDTFHLT